MRGLGNVYKPGPVYWIRYHHRGREYRESARSDDQEPVVPKGYYLKRVDEWEAPGGARWGLYAVTPW